MRYVSLVIVVGLVTLFSSCLKSIDTSQADQFTSDTTSISNYLLQNSIPATKLSSGVWFIIDSGSYNGVRATYQDSISITYTMTVMGGGATIDQQTSPKHFRLDSLIEGIRIAMPFFPKGSKGRIFIPSYYGYGATPQSLSVPANANLIFSFNLKDIRDYHLDADTTTIDNYLQSKNIANIHRDLSGLRYTIDTVGVGGSLGTVGRTITFKYGLKLFSSGSQVVPYTTTAVQAAYYDLPLAWQIVFAQVPVGSYVTVYVPSSLGYGPSYYSGSGISIPANSILIYQIKIVSAG